jgi:hypothetical protein
MKKLTRDDILKSDDRKGIEYHIDAWDGAVYLWPMSVAERIDFESEFCTETGGFKDLKDPNLIYALLQLCMKDERGVPLFKDISEVGLLKMKDSRIVRELFKASAEINYPPRMDEPGTYYFLEKEDD